MMAIFGKSHEWIQKEQKRCRPAIDGVKLEHWIRYHFSEL